MWGMMRIVALVAMSAAACTESGPVTPDEPDAGVVASDAAAPVSPHDLVPCTVAGSERCEAACVLPAAHIAIPVLQCMTANGMRGPITVYISSFGACTTSADGKSITFDDCTSDPTPYTP